MSTSKSIGNQHLEDTFAALQHKLKIGTWPENINNQSRQTAQYIWDKFPTTSKIECKLYQKNSDHHNDLIIVKDNIEYPINLFFVQGSGIIQPKNLGSKSFLSKYFLDEITQNEFNSFMEIEYNQYLNNLLELKGVYTEALSNTRELKAKVRTLYSQFDEASNISRDQFLYSIRDYCYSLLQRSYNTNREGFKNAFDVLLMAKQTNIITRVKNKKINIEEFNPKMSEYFDIIVYKKGRNTIGIHYGNVALTLRFKFENKPHSSIKLATSFEVFKRMEDFQSQNINHNYSTLNKIDDIVAKTNFSRDKNTSNAVGKCHEAFSYYWIVKKNPSIIQADDNECSNYLQSYLSKIDSNTAASIQLSSERTAEIISEYVYQKKGALKIEGIQLVADIYTKDRLNTGDLKISLRLQNNQVEELFISLKAIQKIGQKITTKNPGIGTILSSTYFNIKTDLSSKVAEVKAEYDNGLERQECLRQLSNEIGSALEHASQENLRKGIQNLLGKALMVITAYEQNKSFYIEHSNVNSNVEVLRNVPSQLQNTLFWNEREEQISLRVKFSSGQSHGWSSIKLTSEYTYKPNI